MKGNHRVTRTLWIELCVLLAIGAAPALADERPPNVVIILTDDQGTLDAGCYGSTDLDTPAIDRLAERGVRFTQAYAHTVCCPCRAMLMTGRYPQRCNVNTWQQGCTWGPKRHNMFLSEVTLAEVFREAGYRTALFGKWHLGAHPDHGPTRQGFDEFFGIRDGYVDNYAHCFLHRTGWHDLFEGTKEVFRRGEYLPEMITDRAMSFVQKNYDRPFFLYFALNIPHYPEQSLARFQRRYKDMPEPRRSYAAMVSTTDEYIGRLIAQLEAFGLLDRTIIVFMSDNGHSEEDLRIAIDHHPSGHPKGFDFGAHGGGGNTGRWIGAKGSFFEGGIRVPAILSYPAKLPKAIVRDQAVTAMDWYPTLLELCGIEPPEGVKLDGHSVLPLVEDASAPSGYGEVMHWQWEDGWMVRQGDWKLIVGGFRSLGGPKLPQVYLGNLADERPEAINHAEARPEVVERLRRLHKQWHKEVMPKS